MSLYEELLNYGENRIFKFFENYQLYETQYKYSDFNNVCLNHMYKNNNPDEIKSVKQLKQEISELTPTCKKCGNFYMTPRNNSEKIQDVLLGRLLEDIIIDFLNDKFKLKAMHGDNSNKKYPDCLLLNTDKEILAYFEVKYHGAPFLMAYNKIGRYCYEGSATLDLKKLINQIEIIESDLERPVFYVHWIDYPCLKGIFFETHEQIKNELYNLNNTYVRKERSGDYKNKDFSDKKIGYTTKFYSKLLEMGTFEELIDIFKDMKKCGMRS